MFDRNKLNKLRLAYVKVYGKRWKEYWIKYHWCVYDAMGRPNEWLTKPKKYDTIQNNEK